MSQMYPSDIFSKLYGDDDKNLDLVYPKQEAAPAEMDDVLQTNIFNVMLNRRSQRKFEGREVEDWKLEMIFAAADTAPTAGGFQGFEIFNVKNDEAKLKLAEAANKQPYVNAPVVLVFCMNPSRVKMNFPAHIIKKFSVQDATLAAAYAQLAAHALGLSSVWIGMFDEEKVMQALGTDLVPSCILCLGYPFKMLQPKPKRSLVELIREI
ncbi:MAG: nitroreductase family protein [Nitrososphaera sp.]|nr:nitroreductase family protein [Nitrososphaera sp.]